MFTPDSIQTAAFTISKSGYDPMEVDHLLDQLAFSWETEASAIRLLELAVEASLTTVQRGYDCDEVEALLTQVREFCGQQTTADLVEEQTDDDGDNESDDDADNGGDHHLVLIADQEMNAANDHPYTDATAGSLEPLSDEAAPGVEADTPADAGSQIDPNATEQVDEPFAMETAEEAGEVSPVAEGYPVETTAPAATIEAIGAVPHLDAPVPDLTGLADAIARTMRTMGGLQSFVENEVATVKVSCERQVDETQLACERMLDEAREVAADYIARARAHADDLRGRAEADVADLRRLATDEIEAQRRASDESIARREAEAEERWTERTNEVETLCAERLASAEADAERRIAEAEREAEAIQANAEARERSAREVVDNAANLQATILASIEHARAALIPDASGS
jgi:DivIVA domain-containing protein